MPTTDAKIKSIRWPVDIHSLPLSENPITDESLAHLVNVVRIGMNPTVYNEGAIIFELRPSTGSYEGNAHGLQGSEPEKNRASFLLPRTQSRQQNTSTTFIASEVRATLQV